jgi:hypothetical protein
MTQYGPLRISEDDDRNGVLPQILLKANILVRGDQHIESSFLSGL